jgi:NAD-dependent DNA ligase
LIDILPAFSIPLIGRSASQKLCDTISNIEDISENSCTEAGIGPKASANLVNFMETEFYPNRYKDTLPFNWNNKINKKKEVTGVVCISGKLKSYPTKAHATKVLEQYGFVVKSSLTKVCTHLINESGIESAKTETARDRGVIIISNIKHLIGEN